VLSNRVHDVTLSNPNAPWHTYTTDNEWPWSFSVAISVYSDGDVLVANNQLPAAQRVWNVSLSLVDSKGNNVTVDNVEYLSNNRCACLGGGGWGMSIALGIAACRVCLHVHPS